MWRGRMDTIETEMNVPGSLSSLVQPDYQLASCPHGGAVDLSESEQPAFRAQSISLMNSLCSVMTQHRQLI